MKTFSEQCGVTAEQAAQVAENVLVRHGAIIKKWTVGTLICSATNNEQHGIIWHRWGIPALGEPRIVERIEYYDTAAERDLMVFKSPKFARN